MARIEEINKLHIELISSVCNAIVDFVRLHGNKVSDSIYELGVSEYVLEVGAFVPEVNVNRPEEYIVLDKIVIDTSEHGYGSVIGLYFIGHNSNNDNTSLNDLISTDSLIIVYSTLVENESSYKVNIVE